MNTIPKNIIAVSQRVDIIRNRDETRDALDQKFCELILASGFLPVPVPNVLSCCCSVKDWIDSVSPCGFLLSGGNDIGEIPVRDNTEHELINHAETNSMPVLGICRGMQILGTRSGGVLVPLENHVRVMHKLLCSENFSFPDKVNSFHNFGFVDCPPGYIAVARTSDGVIEAIRHSALPWEGWMWHPERAPVFNELDIKKIQYLFTRD